jgi:hypothetical protein
MIVLYLGHTVLLLLLHAIEQITQLVSLSCLALPEVPLSEEALKLSLKVTVYVCMYICMDVYMPQGHCLCVYVYLNGCVHAARSLFYVCMYICTCLKATVYELICASVP